MEQGPQENTEGSGSKEPYVFKDNGQPELAVSREDTTEMLQLGLEDKWIHRPYLILCIVSDVEFSVVAV
ncbi:hypothetical protein QQF64_032356 [Cirrhinus molitorella]|uniref:Uncharacterized protein n=1 Tax=Cirrhinus molitorella TaxID=172907 RepID=A0ABR3MZJ3_9TELE